jgi:DNA-binding response OmpR family regulator
MHMITEWRPVFHPRCTYRILYAGNDLSLLKFLREILEDCQMMRCPNGAQARLFIKEIKYSLLLFDEQLPDATGRELTAFARESARIELTPSIIIKKSADYDVLARDITRIIAASR